MNAAEYQRRLSEREASAPLASLRRSMYSREGVEATDDAIRRGLRVWAVERESGSPGYRLRSTTIVFGRNASDAKRRAAAPARLGEEGADDVTRVAEITSGWETSVVWPCALHRPVTERSRRLEPTSRDTFAPA